MDISKRLEHEIAASEHPGVPPRNDMLSSEACAKLHTRLSTGSVDKIELESLLSGTISRRSSQKEIADLAA